MVKRSKFRKSRKTELRGLRISPFLPLDINPKDIEKMGEIVREILRNSYELTEKDRAILKQTYFLVLRRKALKQEDQKKAQILLEELNNNERTLYQLEFEEYKNIRPLNFWVLEMEREEKLEELLRQMEGKVIK